MSEIKGQILGIVLVLAVFGAVAGLLVNAFKTSATNVGGSIATEPTISAKANIQSDNVELLTF